MTHKTGALLQCRTQLVYSQNGEWKQTVSLFTLNRVKWSSYITELQRYNNEANLTFCFWIECLKKGLRSKNRIFCCLFLLWFSSYRHMKWLNTWPNKSTLCPYNIFTCVCAGCVCNSVWTEAINKRITNKTIKWKHTCPKG